MRWRCGAAVAAHRWKGVAKGNWFRVSLRRQTIPNSERNRAPSAFTCPRVSKAMVTNTWVAGNSAYFSDLRTAACSPAEPIALLRLYFPADQRMSVAPSGCLPSFRSRSDGSFVLGTSALCSERQMISFLWHDDGWSDPLKVCRQAHGNHLS